MIERVRTMDPELLRVTQLLSTDEELLSYIRKMVLARLTVDTLADKKWIKAVVDFSVEEAIKKLELDRLIVSARLSAEADTNITPKNNNELKPSFSDSEPWTGKPRKGKKSQKVTAKGSKPSKISSSPATEDKTEKFLSPLKPVTAVSADEFAGSRKFSVTVSTRDENSASPALNSPEDSSPKKRGILIDDDVLMESASESVSQSFELTPPESPPRHEYVTDEYQDGSGDSLRDFEPDERAVDEVDSDEDTVPGAGAMYGADENNYDDALALDDSDTSGASRHVRFDSALEDVRFIENVHKDLDQEEKEKLFFTHMEGNRSNYCYQKQKEKACLDGYDNWNDYVSAKSEEELEAEDEDFSRDFDYMLENRYNHIWGEDESSEESEDGYAYMHNNIDDGDPEVEDNCQFPPEDGDFNPRLTVDLGATLRRGGFPQNLPDGDDDEVDEDIEVHEAADDDW